MIKKEKLGRNAPCTCGSGKKFKRCCGRPGAGSGRSGRFEPPPEVLAAAELAFQRRAARQRYWAGRYGQVPIPVVTRLKDTWLIASGGQLFSSSKWVTFHDFLLGYIKGRLGHDWGTDELAKPPGDRNPLLNWYQRVCAFQARHVSTVGQVAAADPEGVVGAYLRLAYDLFTIQHAMLLEGRLLARLKRKRDFQGARYELQIAAAFVRAGFDLALEDESDVTTSHCEFTARHRGTGATFSVEAKSRHRPGVLSGESGEGMPGKPAPDITRLLQKALKKRADHKRIIFIDVNVPPGEGAGLSSVSNWTAEVVAQVRRLEERQSADAPWPEAFVFFTNQPDHYLADNERERGHGVAFGAINIPSFDYNGASDLQPLRVDHPAIFELLHSIVHHVAVPHDLDWMANA